MTHTLLAATLLIATPALAQLDVQPEAPAPCTVQLPEDAGRDAFIAERWPDGIVPYAFEEDVYILQRDAALHAMGLITDVARVRFVPRTDQDDYILIRDSDRNSSRVGRVGGPQDLNVVSWEHRYIIVHEFMHALGSWHEHQRPDRNQYVQINYQNIVPGYWFAFDIETTAEPLGAYDFDSVMHYNDFAFSEDGQPTITARPPYEMYQNHMGQLQMLSEGDVLGLVDRYGPAPRSDLTDDNFVNGVDLGILLNAWGSSSVDFDGDGVAGTSDLGILLAEWDR